MGVATPSCSSTSLTSNMPLLGDEDRAAEREVADVLPRLARDLRGDVGREKRGDGLAPEAGVKHGTPPAREATSTRRTARSLP